MTLKEVARRANVSVSTASKALKNSFDVAEATRERVFRAAQELGYFNEKKRVTVENHRPDGWRIAVLCPEVISPHYSEAVQAITAAAKATGCRTVIYNIGFQQEDVAAIAQDCVDDPRVDAILSLTSLHTAPTSDTVPIVVLSHREATPYSGIYTDLDAALLAIRRKYSPETTIAVAGEALTHTRQERIRELLSASVVVGNGRYEEAGQDAADQLLRLPVLPQVVLCTYDEIAYGLIARLTERGIAVPDEVEVIAVNNSYSSRWVYGGVSAVAFDYGDVFSEVIRDMANDLQQRRIRRRTYRVTTRFIERHTTK